MTRSDVTTLNHPVAALDDLPDAVLVPRRQRDRGRFDDVGHRDPEQALVAGGQGGELLDRRGLGRQPHDVAVGVAHSGERIPEVSIHENDLSGGDAATIVLLSPAAPQGSLVGFDPGPATLMAGRDHERGLPITSTTIHSYIVDVPATHQPTRDHRARLGCLLHNLLTQLVLLGLLLLAEGTNMLSKLAMPNTGRTRS